MKMIISCRRNPAMTRPEFFHHLRHIHWPLVRDVGNMASALRGYVQNHALGADFEGPTPSPYAVATDRDSVIELFLDGEEGLQRLIALPEYHAEIRPDEARFNDLAHNIMVKTTEEDLFSVGTTGRCKRFDYLVRSANRDVEEFRSGLTASAHSLILNPAYTARIDRHVHNWPIGADPARGGQGFGVGHYDCVRELWASSTANLIEAAAFIDEAHLVDPARSFTIYATEFTMMCSSSG